MTKPESQVAGAPTQDPFEISDLFIVELLKVNKNLKQYERQVRKALAKPYGIFEFTNSVKLPSGLTSSYESRDSARKALHLQLKVLKKLSKSYDTLLSLAGNNPELSKTKPENFRKQIKFCAEACIALFEFCQFVKDYPCTNEEAIILNKVFLDIELLVTSYKDQPLYNWELTSIGSFIERNHQNGY